MPDDDLPLIYVDPFQHLLKVGEELCIPFESCVQAVEEMEERGVHHAHIFVKGFYDIPSKLYDVTLSPFKMTLIEEIPLPRQIVRDDDVVLLVNRDRLNSPAADL